jgi:hypothetical protein
VVHGVAELDRHLERYQEMRGVQEFRELVTSTGIRAQPR